MISDQGREFVNKVNEELMALAGMEGTMLHVIRTLSSPPPPPPPPPSSVSCQLYIISLRRQYDRDEAWLHAHLVILCYYVHLTCLIN